MSKTFSAVLDIRRLAAALACLAALATSTQAAEVPFDLARWVVDDPKAKVEDHEGRSTLVLPNGTAFLKDVSFQDGTVEVDLAPSTGMLFAGIVFRVESAENCESFYLRPFKSGLFDATQYTPRDHGIDAWQLYSGEGFTAAATFSPTAWTHLKLVFEGRGAKAYLDNRPEPVLVVKELKRELRAGSVGLWGLFGARFANFCYTPASTSAAVAPATEVAPAPGTLTRWQLSQPFNAETAGIGPRPTGGATVLWKTVTTAGTGLLNIAEHVRKESRLGIVYARVKIDTREAQTRKLSFGYSDRVTVFLNDNPIYSGNASWRSRDPSFLGIVSAEHDAVYLPLRAGSNELVLAVTELFGGWGLMARLDSIEGLVVGVPDGDATTRN